jgi:dTDP-4-amino-4,6-dideoxygalactose transaminase
MSNPHQATKDFESALCEYTGAKYAVTTNSCTMALLLAVAWDVQKDGYFDWSEGWDDDGLCPGKGPNVSIPQRTYVSVPQSIVHAGATPVFREEEWSGAYQLKPLAVWDSARRFTSGMYQAGQFQCVSFHATKILGDTQGGAILHDNAKADAWLRRARFDGRTEGVAPKDDNFTQIGWHCYISPDVSARLLLKLYSLPKHNADLPNDDYPDLSKCDIFR